MRIAAHHSLGERLFGRKTRPRKSADGGRPRGPLSNSVHSMRDAPGAAIDRSAEDPDRDGPIPVAPPPTQQDDSDQHAPEPDEDEDDNENENMEPGCFCPGLAHACEECWSGCTSCCVVF